MYNNLYISIVLVSFYTYFTGDSLINVSMNGRSADKKFSTFDSDNGGASRNCAVDIHSGWWYSDCEFSDLNKKNMNWVYDMGYTIKESMMMVSREV